MQALVTLSRKPEPRFDPRNHTSWPNLFRRLSEILRTQGYYGTLNKLRMETTIRKGTLVGTDENGNNYFEDKTACYGAARHARRPPLTRPLPPPPLPPLPPPPPPIR